jgi:hypothetical protein
MRTLTMANQDAAQSRSIITRAKGGAMVCTSFIGSQQWGHNVGEGT